MEESQTYLREQVREVLRVVDTCLASIYAGETHMYRALAGQLRILLCDTQRRRDNSLLIQAYPKLEVSALASIAWSERDSGMVELRQPDGGEARVAEMPFEITQFANGLSIANLILAEGSLVAIDEWASQEVTYHPTILSAFDIIRTVADKGGGAHVDAKSSPELRYMMSKTPVGSTYAEMFILAVGRFIQALGERLFDYQGARVPEELYKQPMNKYSLVLAAHRQRAEALTNRCR